MGAYLGDVNGEQPDARGVVVADVRIEETNRRVSPDEGHSFTAQKLSAALRAAADWVDQQEAGTYDATSWGEPIHIEVECPNRLEDSDEYRVGFYEDAYAVNLFPRHEPMDDPRELFD